jgi:hypothetical protein
MLDQSAIQNNFIGRDGFVWWIGQIAPLDSMKKQSSGGGWGNRFKVRIMGYHPLNEDELSNEDLPWAQALIPTTSGSGAANVMTGVQLQPGDMVFGFFLDGDNAQVPVIMATFARTDSVSSKKYDSPFVPFTGFSKSISQSLTTPFPESNEPKENSNRTPQTLKPKKLDRVSKKAQQKVFTSSSSVGKRVTLANSVKNSAFDRIKSVVQNLIDLLKTLKGNRKKIKESINQAIDKITNMANDIVGTLFRFLIKGNKSGFGGLIKLIKEGLNLLYKLVFSKVLAATGNPVAAHLAGVAAQEVMVYPVKLLEESFSQVVGLIVGQVKNKVSSILKDALKNYKRFVSCAAEQFTASFMNDIIGLCEKFLKGPLDAIFKILQFFTNFNLGDVLRDSIGMLSEYGIGLFTNQSLKSYARLANEWILGVGYTGSTSTVEKSMQGTFENVREITKDIKKKRRRRRKKKKCNSDDIKPAPPPKICIFGGGGEGEGGKAVPIFGNTVVDNDGEITASIVGIQLVDPGFGYDYPPFVEICDEMDQGYGAVARCTITDDGKIDKIYMISEGEGYSVGSIFDYSVTEIFIEDGGFGYQYDNTLIFDDEGNEYEFILDDEGSITQIVPINTTVDGLPIIDIISETGSGAVIIPILGSIQELQVTTTDDEGEIIVTTIDSSQVSTITGDNSIESVDSNLFKQKSVTSIDCPT